MVDPDNVERMGSEGLVRAGVKYDPEKLVDEVCAVDRGCRRMMSRRARSGAGVLLLVWALSLVTGMSSPAAAGAEAKPQIPRRVLIVTAPRLTWQSVRELRPPAILSFADGAALASTSVRTAGSITDTIEGYLTLGAGNRVVADGPTGPGDRCA